MARKKYNDRLTPDQLRLKAKLDAMEREKIENEKRRLKNLEIMRSLPDFIRKGAEFVETLNGTQCVVTRIDTNDPSGIFYKCVKFNGEPYDDSDMEFRTNPDILENVARGLIIFRGHTPDILRFGFRFTEVSRAGEVVIVNAETPYSTSLKLMRKYNEIKPHWL